MPVAISSPYRVFDFIRVDPRLLAFGFLVSFGSGFGQTYFIALFSGQIRDAFSITNGEFGAAYSIATLASAFLLIWSGRWIDQLDLRKWSFGVIFLLGLSCIVMAITPDYWVLIVAMFLLRQMGQGLMSHTSITSQARYYESARGRAVATASLGHPLASAILPLFATVVVAFVGWRESWFVFSAILILAILPVSLWLLRSHDVRHSRYLKHSASGKDSKTNLGGGTVRQWDRREMLRDTRFYVLLPSLLAPAFITTGFFFHQVFLVDAKGWNLEVWAAAFIAYSASNVVALLGTGIVIDRYGSANILPVLLIPLTISCFLLGFSDHSAAIWGFMVTAGITAGIVATFIGAFWAEFYGTRHLGSIRSVSFSLMVLSSALSPVVMGVALDWGVSIEAIANICGVYCLFGILTAIYARSRFLKPQNPI